MDEILKSEIFIVICEKKEGVSLEEFGGLFRQVHGYYLNLSNYGYSSLRKLLNDMNDLVELNNINGRHMIRCKSPSRHHVVVSNENNSSQAKKQVSGLSNILLPSSGPSPGSFVRTIEQTQPTTPKLQAQPTPLQMNHIKQVNGTFSATGKKSKETSKSKCSLPAKNTYPAVCHMNDPQPVKFKFSINKKTSTINKATRRHAVFKPLTSKLEHTRPTKNVAIAVDAAKISPVSKTRQESNTISSNPKSQRNVISMQNVRAAETRAIQSKTFSATSGPGIQPNMSYASVCASNVNKNHFSQNGQFAPNDTRFNVITRVNATNVTQSYSRAEPRTSKQLSSVIKENIQILLTQHANGLSVFQLQKIYLFTFQQPLKFKGSVKQLLLELKDVVKTEGVGVQMLVFPVSEENNPSTAAKRYYDVALQVAEPLFIKNDFQKEVVFNPNSSNTLKTQNEKLQEAAQTPLHDDQILTSEQHQMDSIERHITTVVKMEHKRPTLQNVQNVENIPSNADLDESPRKEMCASDARVFVHCINEKQKAPSSAQMHKNNSQEEISSLCKNLILKEAANKNGPSQNAPEDSKMHQVILHSSGFSFVMGQQIIGSCDKASEMVLADTTSSLTEQTPYHSNMLQHPEHSQQMLSNKNSNVLLCDTEPDQVSDFHVENTKHSLLQPHNSMNKMEAYEPAENQASQPGGDFQTANNCNITENPPSQSKDSLQSNTAFVPIEKPSSIQNKNSSGNRIKVAQLARSSSNSLENTPNPYIMNNVNIFSNLSSNEKAPDVQTKNVNEKTSQEVSASLPSNDLSTANTHDLDVHVNKQVVSMSSDVHKTVYTGTSKTKQDQSTLQTKTFDEFTTAERFAQTNLLSSRSRQDIVDPPQNISKEPNNSVEQSKLQNKLENIPKQEDMTTWQTSQGQVCCIL